MSIQLISVSHKTADLNIRSCFALTKEKQMKYLKEILSVGCIEECALLSTCNRLEITCTAKMKIREKSFRRLRGGYFG